MPRSSAKNRIGAPYALLAEVFDVLKELPSSPHTRELHAQASSYEITMKGWEATSPTAAQRAALLDLVTELHAKTLAARMHGSRGTTLPPPTGPRRKPQ